MHDDSTVYVIDKLNEFSEKEMKIPKRENGDVDDNNSVMNSQSQQVFQVLKKYKVNFICVVRIYEDQIVTITVFSISCT